MSPEEQTDAIEACGRMIAFNEPMPRVFNVLVDQVVEARGGWDGNKPSTASLMRCLTKSSPSPTPAVPTSMPPPWLTRCGRW
jgi:hypothetical protein